MNNGVDLMSQINSQRKAQVGTGLSTIGGFIAPTPEERADLRKDEKTQMEATRSLDPSEQEFASGLLREMHAMDPTVFGEGVDPKAYVTTTPRSMMAGGLPKLREWHAAVLDRWKINRMTRPTPVEQPRAVFNLEQAATDLAGQVVEAERRIKGPKWQPADPELTGLRTSAKLDTLVNDVYPNINNPKAKITISPEYGQVASFANLFRKREASGDPQFALDLAKEASAGFIKGPDGKPRPVDAMTQQLAAQILRDSTIPESGMWFWKKPARTELPARLRTR